MLEFLNSIRGKDLDEFGEFINSNEQPVNSGGYWIGDAIDKYLGIRFKDEDNEKHYGWVSIMPTERMLLIA